MGYTTTFQGKISITPELTAPQIRFIKSLHDNLRDIAPADAKLYGLDYQQWELNENLDGLEWDGGEKFYKADKCMEYLVAKTLEKFPELKFNGIITAQGEEFDDRWKLTVKNNKVTRTEIKLKGQKVTCPHCEEDFILED